MAESLAFFDRPKEPRVGFELPVPRCARPADSALLAASPDSVVSSSSWNGPLHSIGCQGRQLLGCHRRAYGRLTPFRTKPENCCLSGAELKVRIHLPPAASRTNFELILQTLARYPLPDGTSRVGRRRLQQQDRCPASRPGSPV